MKLKKPSLIVQIFSGMVLGVIIGYFWKDAAVHLHLLSDIFMRLIKMIISPLIFAVLVVGIAKVGDFKSVGRIGIKTLLYFTSAAFLSLLVGLLLVNITKPGMGMQLTLPEVTASSGFEKAKSFDAKTFVEHVIPSSIADAMAKNDVLPVVVFALFFGVATASIGKKGKIVIDFFDAVSHVMFKVTNYVMTFAPLGVFGALAAVVAQQGLGILLNYLYLIGAFYFGLLLFIFVILFSISALCKINFFKLLSHIKEPILLAFSTASSEAAMPKTIESLERFGCGNRIVSFVLPLGYSFNLDGSMMYITFATVFIAQAYGIEMSVGNQILMLLILLLTSKGMAGIPRASLVVIAGTLGHFHIPVAGILLLLGVDQILDMGRSATNVVGNAVATAVISKWEGELHHHPVEDIDKIKLS
ncbi:MAG TPA: cation:dicarboxylase symporter family transporter [Bacteroidia bacterium]|nr:cation:dicarboxylase symporter family transporter [Bacteroidia bacterium]